MLRRFVQMAMQQSDGLEILRKTAQELDEFAGDHHPSDTEPDKWAAHCQSEHIKGYLETTEKVNSDLGIEWCDTCRGFYLPHEH